MSLPPEVPHVPFTEEGMQRLALADATLAAALSELDARVKELERKEAAHG